MNTEILVLIVHDDPQILRQLKALLGQQRIPSRYATNCEEARRHLSADRVPDVVFTGTDFNDGTWRDVLALARASDPRPAVVLTTRLEDMSLYLDAMDEDAFDYMVPPFAARDVASIISSAAAHGFGNKYRVAGVA
jgi:DNA-binding NtrC family response regulator